MRLCQALKSAAFFSWILFHDQVLADDTAFVSAYRGETSQETILFHAVIRELRPPTVEEEMAIGDCIQLRHRSQLWNIMSRGLHMTSTLPRGTARESTLVMAIKADYPPMFDDGPLPVVQLPSCWPSATRILWELHYYRRWGQLLNVAKNAQSSCYYNTKQTHN